MMELHGITFLLVFSQFLITTHQYENLAGRKPVKVSQRYNNGYFGPNKAVDGDRSTYLLDCSLTAARQREAWLTVDLGERKHIASISILHGGLGLNASSIKPSDSGLFPNPQGDGVVFVYNPIRQLCVNNFDEKDAQVVCLVWGFLPDNPLIFPIPGERISAPFYENILNCAGNEVNINTCPKGFPGCPLGSTLALRCKNGSTLSGFSVYVSETEDWRTGTLCHQHDIRQIPQNNINIDCVTSGRYVTVYNTRNRTIYPNVSEFSYINICEIEVKGCDLGFFGENCTRCPQNCLNNTCHFQIGECFECKDGYRGQYCQTECDQGFYGRQCSMTCSDSCLGRLCDPTTGRCNSCIDGRSGFFCETEVGASTDMNTWTMIAVGLLSVVVILLIVILLVCYLKKKQQSSTPNKNSPGYEQAISKTENNKYTGIHAAKSHEYLEVERPHYMEIVD